MSTLSGDIPIVLRSTRHRAHKIPTIFYYLANATCKQFLLYPTPILFKRALNFFLKVRLCHLHNSVEKYFHMLDIVAYPLAQLLCLPLHIVQIIKICLKNCSLLHFFILLNNFYCIPLQYNLC